MDFIWFHYIMNGEKGGMGHVFGVRVDGAAPRGFLRFLSLTAFQAEGGGGGFAADFKEKGRDLISFIFLYPMFPGSPEAP